jgi:hypothetical protein
MEHREREGQRVRESATLSERFAKLKSLTVHLSYFDANSEAVTSQFKYTVNLASAKSVFRFNCPNTECVRGDFDLTAVLVKAVAQRKKKVAGELTCCGWQSKSTINRIHCNKILRYQLTLAY